MKRLWTFCLMAGGLFGQSLDSFEYIRPDGDMGRKAAAGAVEAIRAGLGPAAERVLAPLDRAAIDPEPVGVGPRKSGAHREIAAGTLAAGRWETTREGRAIWRLGLRSPGAVGMRIHFTNFDAGSGAVWLHDGAASDGPYSGRGLYGDGEFWSAVAFGESVTVEYLPGDGRAAGAPPFEIGKISHLWDSPDPAKAVTAPNAVAPCHVDVTCASAEWRDQSKAVARITFEKDGSYLCSGTLMNTTDTSRVPYFLTAQHCLDDNTVARTVVAYWNYQTTVCNGRPPSPNGLPVSQGAQWVISSDFAGGDFTLIRLNSVPDGVIFSGWTADEPAIGAPLVGIHHPTGDFKRISTGVRDTDDLIRSVPKANFYTIRWSQGRTEGGSSGSPVFNARRQVVGTLSHGPSPPKGLTVCDIEPIDFYGRFSVHYRVLRRFLEPGSGGGTNPPPAPTQQVGGVLVSGQPRTFSLQAVTAPTLLNGASSYRIDVPQGAARLEIRLSTAAQGVDIDLYTRFGGDPVVANGAVTSDHKSDNNGGEELIAVTPQSSPSLRAGTYYIALAIFTTGRAATGTLSATVTQAAGSGGNTRGIQLAPGAPATFRFGALKDPTLMSGDFSYRIDVPDGATRLDVKLATATPGVDVDLYVTYGRDNSLNSSGRVVSDHRSEGDTGNEEISISSTSTPPLRAGTYYISMVVWTRNQEVTGTITATPVGRPSSAPPAPTTLVSGQPAPFALPSSDRPTLFTGNYQYKVVVPPNTARLDLRVRTASADVVDVDVYVRRDAEVDLGDGGVIADWSAAKDSGNEDLVITTRSDPALQPGTYWVALVLWTSGRPATGTVTASLTPAVGQELISGEPQRFSLPAVSNPSLFYGDAAYRIYVPPGAVKLDLQVSTESGGVDVDVAGRYEQEVRVVDGNLVHDYISEGPTGEELITVDGGSDPPLQSGTYYFALILYSTGQPAQGTITATITMGDAPSSKGSAWKKGVKVKAWPGTI